VSSREELIKVIRRSQTYVSILLFLFVFVICWKFTNFDIREIELSKWGKVGWIGKIWNTAICLFSISIFINSFTYLKNNSRIKYKRIFYWLFGFLSLCLFSVGFFNMNWGVVHNTFAGLYFFFYPFTIFLFSYLNRKYLSYMDWQQKVIISILMAVLPMILLSFFKGMAIAEISHTALVIIYNIKLSRQD
jgi:hypothetical protein